MSLSPSETYLETQVSTATPQRLRLMLITAAIRQLRKVQAAYQAGQTASGDEALAGCREIVTELIAGISPNASPLARRVLGLYVYVYSQLVELRVHRDLAVVNKLIDILGEEEQTWQEVCQKWPDRIAPDASLQPVEELAPGRVLPSTPTTYAAPSGWSAVPADAPAGGWGLSLDA
jgi:flagellar protein FliS